MQRLTFRSADESSSLELGRLLGQKLRAGDIVALWGELGAGKTLLTRGIARGLGIPPEIPITSPTFTFVNEYEGRLRLYHLDLYRLGDPGELETLPWREALFGTGVAVVEWPDRLDRSLPDERLDIELEIIDEESRSLLFTAHGRRYEELLHECQGAAGS